MEELQKINEAEESFNDSIHQAIEALYELQKLSGESCLKTDFRKRAIALERILKDVNWDIRDLKKVVREEAKSELEIGAVY